MRLHCRDCQAFQKIDAGPTLGLCRKYAPRPGPVEATTMGNWDWPTVDADIDFCLEHMPLKTKKKLVGAEGVVAEADVERQEE